MHLAQMRCGKWCKASSLRRRHTGWIISRELPYESRADNGTDAATESSVS